MTHICVVKLTIIGSDNGLSPGRRQAIIWTNAGILLIGPLGTNFNEILIGIQTFSFKKMHLKMSSAKWRPFFLGLNVLTHWHLTPHVMHEYVSGSCVDHHWFWQWLHLSLAKSWNLKKWKSLANGALRKKVEWNFPFTKMLLTLNVRGPS